MLELSGLIRARYAECDLHLSRLPLILTPEF